MKFKWLSRQSSLSDQAAAQIEDLLVGGGLKTGERLPSERDLGERLGVSKTVVREAIRALAARGLVDVRTGSGMYVQRIGPDLVEAPLELLLRHGDIKPQAIYEVRAPLEVTLAGLAAQRARPEHLKAMRAAVHALGEPLLDSDALSDADLAFHYAVADAAENPLFSMLLRTLAGMLFEWRRRASLGDDSGAARRVQSFHQQIFEQIEARQVTGAKRAMRAHLANALPTWRRVLTPDVPRLSSDAESQGDR